MSDREEDGHRAVRQGRVLPPKTKGGPGLPEATRNWEGAWDNLSELLEGIDPSDASISGFQPPELGDTRFPWF